MSTEWAIDNMAKRLKTAEAEVLRYKELLYGHKDMGKELLEMEQMLAVAVEALERLTGHGQGCWSQEVKGGRCDCGGDIARNALARLGKGREEGKIKVEYDYCCHCYGRFSFQKPLGHVCCWCGKDMREEETP